MREHCMMRVLLAVAIAAFVAIPPQGRACGTDDRLTANAPEPVMPDDLSGVHFAQTGSYVEHTPSIIQAANGTFFVAYESASSISGKFTINMTWSSDGANWAPDWVAITSAGTMGNRHPTLIQRQDGLLMMAYFTDRTGAYRVHTATSANGRSWSESAALPLRNPAVNPFLIVRESGGYAMSYQRYGSGGTTDGSYFASSADGATWNVPTSRVTNYVLPRLSERTSGGFLMTYQGGTTGSTFDIRYRTSADGTTWSSETRLTYTGNSHDSFPLVLANDTYMVFFCTSVSGGGYDLYRKWSPDLASWSDNEYLETSNGRFDTEPHPCQLSSNDTILLSWGYESSGAVGGYENVDIALMWIEDAAAEPPFSISLPAGWCLISLPLIQADTAPSAVLASIAGQYEVAKWFSASDAADPWKSYRPGGAANDLAAINHTVGIWVKTNTTCQLDVTGTAPVTTGIPMRAGWNLVGYPSMTGMAASAAFPTGVDRIAVWTPSYPYISDVTDLSAATLSAGKGYWVHATSDFIWTVTW